MAGAGGAGGGALNRYDEVAGFYDAYVATDFDLAFWRSRVRGERDPDSDRVRSHQRYRFRGALGPRDQPLRHPGVPEGLSPGR